MSKPQELEEKFWKALEKDRTVMLGIDGVEDGHTRPMTAITEGHGGPIWFFTSIENGLVKAIEFPRRATATFATKGHDLFASVQGDLARDFDRSTIDRLWNPFIAAWFEGKDDPKLALLRLDAESAEIWLNENSLLAGVKMLVGVDPKKSYKDKVAQVDLH